ncbi:MAG: MarR family winged helix-turn-helix transcriptional regulator [Alkalispirochaeta sp.]
MATHYRGSEREQRALNLFIALTRSSDSFQKAALRRAPLPNGLTLSQFGILEALLHLGSMPQTVVAQKVLKSKGNISIVISHLESRNLVRRSRSPVDRRQLVLELTPLGHELISEYFPRMAQGFADSATVLSAEEQQTLITLCKKLGMGAHAD